MILEARTRSALEEVLVIASALVGAGRSRPADGCPAAGGPGACQVRRREERIQRLLEAVEVDTRRARRTWRHAQAQQPAVRTTAAPELHQRPPRARMARHPFAVAHGRDGAQLAHQCPACRLRAAAPVDARRPARQRGLEDRGRRGVSRRARHQVLPPSRRASQEEAGALDRLRRTGRDHAPVRPRHREHRAAMDRTGRQAIC